MEGFYKKRGWDEEYISKRKMKVHWRKVRVQGDDGFSLANLQHFPLAWLVARQGENLFLLG